MEQPTNLKIEGTPIGYDRDGVLHSELSPRNMLFRENAKKIGLLLFFCGIGGCLGWICLRLGAFFYPPPGIFP